MTIGCLYNEDFRFGQHNLRFGKLDNFHSNQLCIIIKYKDHEYK